MAGGQLKKVAPAAVTRDHGLLQQNRHEAAQIDVRLDVGFSNGRSRSSAFRLSTTTVSMSPVRAENLDPDVLVMQPANQGVRHDASDLLNRARDRSILVQ
jgi:hypothetical protein